MKKNQKFCFYCNAVVTNDSGYGDHFPLPKRNGGIDTVPCCSSCHDMKDRIPITQWSNEWIGIVTNDFQYVSRETKLFLAKMLSLVSDAIANSKGSEI